MSKRWGSSGYSHHYIADFIISHFPESFLQEIGDLKKTYEVFHSEKKLLSIDIKGVTYFFPTRYRENRWSWDGIIEGSPEAVAEICEPNFESIFGKHVYKFAPNAAGASGYQDFLRH